VSPILREQIPIGNTCIELTRYFVVGEDAADQSLLDIAVGERAHLSYPGLRTIVERLLVVSPELRRDMQELLDVMKHNQEVADPAKFIACSWDRKPATK
jgi:hypothetical protein